MKNKDQKSLEFLYESIAFKAPELLQKEKELIEILSKSIVKSLYENLASMKPRYSGPLNNFVYSKFLNPIVVDNIFKVSQEINHSIYVMFEREILGALYNHLIRLEESSNYYDLKPKYVRFKPTSHLKDGRSFKEISIPYENKDKVLKMFKRMVAATIVYFYNLNDSPNPDEPYGKWHAWRKEQLKFQILRKKLPELEGIFE